MSKSMNPRTNLFKNTLYCKKNVHTFQKMKKNSFCKSGENPIGNEFYGTLNRYQSIKGNAVQIELDLDLCFW